MPQPGSEPLQPQDHTAVHLAFNSAGRTTQRIGYGYGYVGEGEFRVGHGDEFEKTVGKLVLNCPSAR